MSALDQAWIEFMKPAAPSGKLSTYEAWRRANPGEWQKLNVYRLGGSRPELVTNIGREHVLLTDAWLAQITQPPPPPPPPPPPSTGFVTRDGARLMLNGQVFTFKGINVYGLLGNCGPTIDMHLLPSGTVIRFWAFRSQVSPAWSNLDDAIGGARVNGQRLIPVLSNAYPDCNGQTDDASFATFIGQIAARYKNEPAILMWQLINEGTKPLSWYQSMAAKVKAADPNHLVSYGDYVNDARASLLSDSDDAVDYHDYNHGSTPMPGQLFTDLKITSVPLIVGESGIRATEISTTQRRDWFKAKIDAAFAAGASGYLLWGWNTTDGFGIQAGDPALGLLA